MKELNEKIEELGRTWEQFKSANDERLKAIEEKSPDPLLEEKVDRMADAIADINTVKGDIERLERIQSRQSTFVDAAADDPVQKEHVQLWSRWMRRRDNDASAELKSFEKEHPDYIKAVTGISDTGTGDSAGHAVPEQIQNMIEETLLEFSEMRQICTVVTAGTPDYKILVDVGGESTGWVGESGSRSATNTPKLEQVAPTFGTLYAYPAASEESLDDVFFDVGSWLARVVGEQMGKAEGIAFISGNGSNKPTGIIAGSTAATSDYDSPARAFGTLEHIPTGLAAAFPVESVDSPASGPGDVLLTAVYKLKAPYRNRARWVMNKNTLATARKWKDQDGRYLWQPSLQMGQPQMLLGYPVTEAQDWPDIGANALAMGFGDFSAAYTIVDIHGMRVTVDNNITSPGNVKWYFRRRMGGKLVKDEALKVIKVATS